MNPLNGTLMIFSMMLLTFFGVPIAGLFIWSAFSPANIGPLNAPMEINPSMNMDQLPIGFPIHVRKVMNKGRVIWIDAVEAVPV